MLQAGRRDLLESCGLGGTLRVLVCALGAPTAGNGRLQRSWANRVRAHHPHPSSFLGGAKPRQPHPHPQEGRACPSAWPWGPRRCAERLSSSLCEEGLVPPPPPRAVGAGPVSIRPMLQDLGEAPTHWLEPSARVQMNVVGVPPLLPGWGLWQRVPWVRDPPVGARGSFQQRTCEGTSTVSHHQDPTVPVSMLARGS